MGIISLLKAVDCTRPDLETAQGKDASVEFLLDHIADANTHDGKYGGAIQAGRAEDHKEPIRELL